MVMDRVKQVTNPDWPLLGLGLRVVLLGLQQVWIYKFSSKSSLEQVWVLVCPTPPCSSPMYIIFYIIHKALFVQSVFDTQK